VIRLVLDNLNTHNPSSLYKAFEPQEARRSLRKLEFHYTPKHGSWLNRAEIAISVLSRPCLQQRLPSIPELETPVTAWTHCRNAQAIKSKWCFNVDNARSKLARLYP
jgi:transposase